MPLAPSAGTIAFFDIDARCWRVEAGVFEVSAGLSAEDTRARASLTLAGATFEV